LNIKDVKLPDGWDETSDMLKEMMFIQERQARAYIEIEGDRRPTPTFPVDLDDPRGQDMIKVVCYLIVEELSEATNCLKMKPHCKTHIHTDRDHFYEELSDALHFFLELLLLVGLSAQDVLKLYLLKSQVNEFRRESGY
jgi:hypothetical protein